MPILQIFTESRKMKDTSRHNCRNAQGVYVSAASVADIFADDNAVTFLNAKATLKLLAADAGAW
jgi:hypothetical protein